MLEGIGISASYKNAFGHKNKQILNEVSFQAGEGQCIGIVGANGTGKTTLLSILAGVHKPLSGKLLYKEKDLFQRENQKDLKKVCGYIPQENPLIEELSVLDNLKLWYTDKKRIMQEMEQGVLADFRFEEYLNFPVNKLSGGMKKRVSIACAIADDPDILIMDEPTAALDMLCKHDVMEYIEKSKKSGKIIIFSTHDETEIKICDKLYVLRAGKLGEVSTNLDSAELIKLQKE